MIGKRILRAVVLLVVLGVSSVIGPAQSSPPNQSKPSFWTGQLEVSVLRCNGVCGYYTVDETGTVRHAPKDLVSYYSYNVYQNDKGIVRHQLIFANTGGINEQGRGAEIVDYAQGYVLAFDPCVSEAVRAPLVFPMTTSTALESREILGFRCNGVRRKWVQQRNRYHDVKETWTATEIDFKDPLLEISYGYDANGLGGVEVRTIRSLKSSPPLEHFLFELPSGMGVLNLDNP